ncbi:fimbrial biogenesis chaperone [Anaeromyxobacter paludicola]|uniref:Pili assembly chaperone N-terminal domain-containing protein n=1 Tax=Anaeromyxobacter paludicola TaxID=2918171 RepID=A0ABM7X6U4_9BACT|nr:fimbria/pilus periplasmic chaperone [Anaeromyxobacter paludicola]BDG07547.1 hypothetical protein AMPC_06600 [Anaeromyxobacter paludicola]
MVHRRTLRRLRPLALAALAVLLLPGGRVRAAGLVVNPILVRLTADERNAVVSVTNDEPEPVRFKVSVLAWQESSSGEMQLAPAEDVVWFPQLFTLAPKESRNLRVGTTQPPGARERSYRLFVEQLPPAEKPGGPSAVRVLSRVGIPVFVEPAQAAARPEIDGVEVRAGRASFVLRNRGNAHFRPTSLKLQARGAAGEVLHVQDFNGWYVLADGERRYDAALPAGICAQVRSVRVEAVLGDKPVSAEAAAPHGGCAP